MTVTFEQHGNTFISRDIEESVIFLESLFAPHTLKKMDESQLVTTVDFIDLNNCIVAISSYNAAVEIQPLNLRGYFQIKIPLVEEITVIRGSEQQTVDSDHGVIINPTDRLIYQLKPKTRCLTVSINQRHVLDRMGRLWGARSRWSFNSNLLFDLNTPDGKIWMQNLSQIWNQIAMLKQARAPFISTLMNSYSNLIIDSFLNLRGDIDKEVNEPDSKSMPVPMQRALSFVDQNYKEKIRLSNIANAAEISARSLQLKFKEYLGLSPQHYLKTKRIQEAHGRLLTASADDTVTEIALGCGVDHLGRFSKDYKDCYGYSPKNTLQNRQKSLIRLEG